MQTEFQFKQQIWLLSLESDDYHVSRAIAATCPSFIGDDEDEQVDDIVRSCVNCAYRRWLVNAIECRYLKVNSTQS